MIKSIALIFLVSTSALCFAMDPIILSQKEMTIPDGGLVARTNETPKKVSLSMMVGINKNGCVREEEINYTSSSESDCGTESSYQRVTISDPSAPGGYRVEYQTVWVPKTCQVTKFKCVERGTVYTQDRHTMTIEFRNLPELADGEKDVFKITGEQKKFGSGSVIFNVELVETIGPLSVRRGKRLFGKSDDDFVVELK